jgi:hypothetical protein
MLVWISLSMMAVAAPALLPSRCTRKSPRIKPMPAVIIRAHGNHRYARNASNRQSIPGVHCRLRGSEISDAHITKIDDLGNLVSNLNITTRADNTPDVVLRGIGSFGVVSGVGFYADDVQLFDGQTVRTEDIERIEVLKGPQGTLYGGSNIGGAIKYVTKLPTDKFEAGVGAEFGNYSTQIYSGFVSGALIPGAFDARASFFDRHTDGYIFDPILNKTVDGGTERGGRLTFAYRNDDSTTATLYLNYDWNKSGDGASLYYRPDTPTDYSLQVTDGTEPAICAALFTHAKFKQRWRRRPHINYSYFIPMPRHRRHRQRAVAVPDRLQTLPTSPARISPAKPDGGAFKWLAGVFAQARSQRLHVTRSFNGDPR